MDQRIMTLIELISSFIFSFIVCFLITKKLIKKESSKNIGQVIKDDIVKSHLKKAKTPTLGGIGIFISTWLSVLIFGYDKLTDRNLISLLIISFSFFLIGLIDDLIKIKSKNPKGLSGYIRLFLEIITVLIILNYLGYEQHSLWKISLLNIKLLPLGFLFIPFVIFVVVGGANSVNMSDGLDGLASGLVMMGMSPFLIISLVENELGIALFLMSLIGSLFAFLFFNFHPAKIFMGDAGSLPLGASLALSSFLLNKEILLLISGGIFVFETISVILQVVSYKTRKKRIFLMAPFHHHLELKGLPEWKVVMILYVVGFVLSIIATLIGVRL